MTKEEVITKRTGVSIAVLLAVVAIAVGATRSQAILASKVGVVEKQVQEHRQAPTLHENINIKLLDDYVTREELDIRLSNIEDDVAEIKKDVKTLLRK